MKRFASSLALLLFSAIWIPQAGILAATMPLPTVELTATRGPRDIEDLTRQKIVHDYAAAWQTLAAGFEQNRPELLNDYFTGFAKKQFTQTIADQNNTGVHRHYVDQGHKVEVLFYSPDGGVIQLQDNAEYELQIFDGARLLHSEKITTRFVVLMTPAADRWMVRLLQDVPAS